MRRTTRTRTRKNVTMVNFWAKKGSKMTVILNVLSVVRRFS